MPFIDSLDIGNRALVHLGAQPIASISEDSTNNTAITFVYDKVRRAELRRNIWRFATRKSVIRAIDTTTMLLVPNQWSATTIYYPGSIVADTNNLIWVSTLEENLNNQPGGNNTAWEMYFGPMTLDLWGGNSVSGPPLWNSAITYTSGQQVTGSNSYIYICVTASNTNINPVTDTGANWTNTGIPNNPVPNPSAYYTGELVYMAGAIPGTFVVYQSLVNNNSNVPNVATAWSATTQYFRDQVISYNNQQWRSLIEFNLNVTPVQGPLPWSSGTTYTSGQQVTDTDNFIYTLNANSSLNQEPQLNYKTPYLWNAALAYAIGATVTGSNGTTYTAIAATTGVNPTTDAGVHWTPGSANTGVWFSTGIVNAWSNSPQLPVADIQWQVISAGMKSLNLRWPAGTGPSSQADTRNLYRLPAGYVGPAPQDPKAGSTNFLGAPSGEMYKDWEFQGNYLVSRDIQPILFRFVADILNVSDMDDMFCEGLACRIAVAASPRVQQSNSDLQTIASAYNVFMGEARRANMIETGPIEPPEDDFVTCRI